MKNLIKEWSLRLFVIVYAFAVMGLICMEQIKKCCINSQDSAPFLVELDDISCGRMITVEENKSDTVRIDKKEIERILTNNNFIDKKDNIALGMFMPIYVMELNSDNHYCKIEFSIVNAEVRVICNGQVEKSVLMRNPDDLVENIENLLSTEKL